jgi:hypothetical protein
MQRAPESVDEWALEQNSRLTGAGCANKSERFGPATVLVDSGSARQSEEARWVFGFRPWRHA